MEVALVTDAPRQLVHRRSSNPIWDLEDRIVCKVLAQKNGTHLPTLLGRSLRVCYSYHCCQTDLEFAENCVLVEVGLAASRVGQVHYGHTPGVIHLHSTYAAHTLHQLFYLVEQLLADFFILAHLCQDFDIIISLTATIPGSDGSVWLGWLQLQALLSSYRVY